MKRILLIGVLAFALCNLSCSRMIIDVSTADLKVVTEETKSLINKNEAYKYSRDRKKLFSYKLFDSKEAMKLFSKLIEQGLKEGKVTKDDAEIFRLDFEKKLQEKTSALKDTFYEGVTLTDKGDYNGAIEKYLDAKEQANKLSEWANLYFKHYRGKDSFEVYKELMNMFDSFNFEINSISNNDRHNLLGDPLVSYITKKENEKIWKSKYNKTKSWTALGNSDIAVVLREDPESYNNNYTIKGVRVDADQLIQSSFDVLAQSINVLASSQGIGVSEDTDNNYFAPTVIPEIQNLETEKSTLKQKEQILKAYKEFIILQILNKNFDSNDNEELKASLKEIKLVWDSYKSNLNKS